MPIPGRASPSSACPTYGLRPGRTKSLLKTISGVEDGILIEGDGSFSIDQQRYNFQFGGDAFWEIKGGKKRGMLSRVAYQASTPDFWHACDGIAARVTGSNSAHPTMARANPDKLTPSATAVRLRASAKSTFC